MEERQINKFLRRKFSGIGWMLLCYYGILNLMVVVAVVTDMLGQMIRSLSVEAGMGWDSDALLDNAWGYICAIAVGAVILQGWKGSDYFRELFTRRNRPMQTGDFVALLSLCIGIQLLNSLWIGLLEALLNGFGLSVMETMDSVSGSADTISMFVYMGILAPLSEEILFRGVVLDALRPYGKRFAILGSAVLFGLFHGNLLQTPYAFLVGLVLGYVTVEHSLIWAVVLHLFNNLVLADLLTRLTENLPVILQNMFYFVIFGGFALASLVVLGLRWREVRSYLQSEWIDRRCLKCFFTNSGVLALIALMAANMISLLFL